MRDDGGTLLADQAQDAVGDIIDVRHHVCGDDPQDPKPLGLQPRVPSFVAFRLIALSVAFAIDLNNETSGRAIEVEDIAAHRMLPPKFQTCERLAAQMSPKQHLRRGHS